MQGISGAFRPRTLTALMGVTGASSCQLQTLHAVPGSFCWITSCTRLLASTAHAPRRLLYAARHSQEYVRTSQRLRAGAGKTTLMDVLAGRKTGAAPLDTLLSCLPVPGASPCTQGWPCITACHSAQASSRQLVQEPEATRL